MTYRLRATLPLVILAIFASSVWPATASAQTPAVPTTSAPDPHAVQPERPTVATHAGTVAPGWIELEMGVEFDRYTNHVSGDAVPIVAKVGLASHAQLNVSGGVVRVAGTDSTGVGDLSVGVKWRLLDDAPVLGRFAILPAVKMRTGSALRGTGTGTTDVSFLVISSHDLGPVAMDLNAGYTHRSGTGDNAPKTAMVWTTSFGGPVAGAVGWTAELYGYPKTSGPARADSIVAFLVGPTLQIRPWLATDVGAIVPITGPQPRAIYCGGVWNVGRLTAR